MIFVERDPSLKSYLTQLGLRSTGIMPSPGEADNWWGPKSEASYQAFLQSMGHRTLHGDGTWPFSVEVAGRDLIVRDIVITCFGGLFDPQDNGETASGASTKLNPSIMGVSLPMDGRQFNLSPREKLALDGSPIPRLPWGTLVEVTIGNKVLVPSAGVIDLGPGKQSSRQGEPHACDLTVEAARFFNPKATATDFYARGDIRIIDGAKYV